MFKKSLPFIILLYCSNCLLAQDIKYFFKKLPPSYTEEFTLKTRDSLLEGKSYYPSSNDSEEVIVYKLEVLDLKKNWLRIEMSYESGQRAFKTLEIRSFKTKTGNSIIVFSDYSGVPHDSWQNILSVFAFDKNKKLIQVAPAGLITEVSIKEFLKSSTPDSIINKYKDYFSINYELGYSDSNNITLNLYGELDPEEFHNWLEGDVIEFVWNGNRFVKQKPKFND